jgi:hypothetical protein
MEDDDGRSKTRSSRRTGLLVTTLGYGAMEFRGAPRARDITEAQAETILNANPRRAGRTTRQRRSAWPTTAITVSPPTSGLNDIGSGLRAAHAIESGWVQVRQGLGQTSGHSYGGYKQSGIGREFSLEGMLESLTQRQKP